MTTDFRLTLVFGAVGALLWVVSNLMKRMVPLRVFALGANGLFIMQATLESNWLFCAMQTALLLINAHRLRSLRNLLVSLEKASADTPVKTWLLPHMKKKRFKAGTVLFNQGDTADELFFIWSGIVGSPHFKEKYGTGQLIGEIGMFSEQRTRVATAICETDIVCYTMSDEAVFLLCLQNPQVGHHLIRLMITQLRGELQHAQQCLAKYEEGQRTPQAALIPT